SCWLVWQINEEVRFGFLSIRLLRPIHPLVAYSSDHLAAVPMRALVAVPFALIMLLTTHGSRIATDPVQIAILPLCIAGAWLITFFSMAIIGSLAMIIQRSVTAWEIWFGLFAVLSGYMIPIDLMPGWIQDVARWLPFWFMLGYPVQVLVGMTTRGAALAGLGIQWAFVAVLAAAAITSWKRCVRSYESFGSCCVARCG